MVMWEVPVLMLWFFGKPLEETGKWPMPSSISILVVSGDTAHREWLIAAISSLGPRPVCCGTYKSAAELLDRSSFSIAFCDDLLPDGTFHSVMDHMAHCGTTMPVIVTSRRDDWDSFLRALNAGAFDYIALPPTPGEVERIVRVALAGCKSSPMLAGEQRGPLRNRQPEIKDIDGGNHERGKCQSVADGRK